MPFDILGQKNWRAELLVPNPATGADESYGFWNRSELTFGSDNSTVTDPEDGTVPIGGKQTAEPVTLTRPFKSSRDLPVYTKLKPRRGRTTASLPIWLLDDFGNPTSATPIDTLKCVFQEIKLPEGEAGGTDASQITVTLEVQP